MLGWISDAIRLFGLAIIGLMMTGVGAALAAGGRPEAIIPLLFGAMAIFELIKSFASLFRKLTANF